MVFSAFSKISFTTGAITGAITTPLDVIKTRLMVQVLEICLVIFFLWRKLVKSFSLSLNLCRDQQISTKGFVIVLGPLWKKKEVMLFWRFDQSFSFFLCLKIMILQWSSRFFSLVTEKLWKFCSDYSIAFLNMSELLKNLYH